MKKSIIFVFAALMVVAFTLPAAAAEYDWYGNARMATFFVDSDFGEDDDGDDITNDANESDNSELLDWDLQVNSRLGANIQATDDIKAQVEIGWVPNAGNLYTRRIYGVWDFGGGSLKVGHDYTPITFFLSAQVYNTDNGLLNRGNAYGSRRGQLGLQFGDFKVAFIDPSTGGYDNDDIDVIIPKIEASYQFKTDMFSIHGFGGYQTYDAKYAEGADDTNTISVDSWVIGVGGEFMFGPVFVKPQVSYYQNGSAAGWLGTDVLTPRESPARDIDIDTRIVTVDNGDVDDVLDTNSLMAMLAVGFQASDMFTLEGGVGYLSRESDSGDVDLGAPIGAIDDFEWKQDYMEYYFQAVMNLADGVFVIPEVGYRDYGDFEVEGDGVDEEAEAGTEFYLGAKWQINF